jgi:hypothetical protein
MLLSENLTQTIGGIACAPVLNAYCSFLYCRKHFLRGSKAYTRGRRNKGVYSFSLPDGVPRIDCLQADLLCDQIR